MKNEFKCWIINVYCVLIGMGPAFGMVLPPIEGDTLVYHLSRLIKEESRYTDGKTDEHEKLEILQVSLIEEERNKDHTVVRISIEVLRNYERRKTTKDRTWRTVRSYHHDIKDKYWGGSPMVLSMNGTYRLFDDGSFSPIEWGDESQIPGVDIVSKLYGYFFCHLPEAWVVGGLIADTLMVKDVLENYVVLRQTRSNQEILVEKKSGRLAEKMEVNEHLEKGGDKEIFKILDRSNIRMVREFEPYTCTVEHNGTRYDTTFSNPNVRIRGRVHNAKGKGRPFLKWSNNPPNQYEYYMAIADYQEDSVFELRIPARDFMRVKFGHYGKFSDFYAYPSLDLWLEVDRNKFHETIKVYGLGASSVNTLFEGHLNASKNEFLIEDFYKGRYTNHRQFEAYQIKEFVLNKLAQRNKWLEDWQKKLIPEFFLAEYWEATSSATDVLLEYSYDGENRHLSSDELNNHFDYESFFDFDTLVQIDNDMMMFMPSVEHFLRRYAFFELLSKIKRTIGEGKIDQTNDFYGRGAERNYGYTDMFFSGMTAHILKYKAVEDALSSDAQLETVLRLIDRFINEFEGSHKAKMLEAHKVKILKVQPGQQAFDFNLKDLSGKNVRLSDYRGKVVFLDFWSPGCCKSHILNHGEEFIKTFRDKPVQVLFIAINGTSEYIEDILEPLDLGDSKVLMATGKDRYLVQEKYYFNSYPHHYIIDVKGRIFKRDPKIMRPYIENPDLLLGALDPNWMKSEDEVKVENLTSALYIAIVTIVFGGIGLLLFKRNSHRQVKLAALNTKVRELELTAIRAQMNPHFMYNCLNSIQNLVQKGMNQEAHQYISRFGSIIRQVLKNSSKEEISLAEELSMIREYVVLEQLRFTFLFKVIGKEELDVHSVFIPPLLLQPIVENAIIHGLSSRGGEKLLKIELENKENQVWIHVIDNGVGRAATLDVDKKTSGKGLVFSEERLSLLSKKYGDQYSLQVIDLYNENGMPSGTSVSLCLSVE